MKKLVFALCMFFGAVAVVNAQDTTSTQSQQKDQSIQTDKSNQQQPSTGYRQEDGRTKIKSQELPDAVKSSLEGQEFRGWLVNSAYKMDGSSTNSTGSTSTTGSTSDSTSVSGSNQTG